MIVSVLQFDVYFIVDFVPLEALEVHALLMTENVCNLVVLHRRDCSTILFSLVVEIFNLARMSLIAMRSEITWIYGPLKPHEIV